MSGFILCIYIEDYQGQTVSDEDLTLVLDRSPTCVDAYAIPASSNTSVHKVPLRNSVLGSTSFGLMKVLHWIPGRFQAIADRPLIVPQIGMIQTIARDFV